MELIVSLAAFYDELQDLKETVSENDVLDEEFETMFDEIEKKIAYELKKQVEQLNKKKKRKKKNKNKNKQ